MDDRPSQGAPGEAQEGSVPPRGRVGGRADRRTDTDGRTDRQNPGTAPAPPLLRKKESRCTWSAVSFVSSEQ